MESLSGESPLRVLGVKEPFPLLDSNTGENNREPGGVELGGAELFHEVD